MSDEHEQRALSVIHELHAEGWSLRRIAAELERRGFLGRSGRRVSPQTISNVLKREAA